jgi:hypothetical protein
MRLLIKGARIVTIDGNHMNVNGSGAWIKNSITT